MTDTLQDDTLTPQQKSALTDLFEAHATQDPILRAHLIRAAERQLVFLAELQGLRREKAA